MAESRLPAVLLLLEDELNPAADAALLAALPRVAQSVREGILELLIRRGRAAAGAELVRLFANAPTDLKSLIAANVEPLHSPLRSMIASTEVSDRIAGIELIEFSNDTKSAYLLAEALRHRCGRTRESAANALRRQTDAAMERFVKAHETDTTAAPGTLHLERAAQGAGLDDLAVALGDALRSWESHVQPAILIAALHLSDRTESALRQKLSDPHSRIAHAVGGILETASDPGLAPALIRCLAIAELRAAAARGIARTRHRPMIDAVLSAAWLLADPAIEHGCRSIRKEQWEGEWIAAVGSLARSAVAPALRLVLAAPGTSSARADLFRKLLDHDNADVRRAALWRLIEDSSETATRLLTSVAARRDSDLAPIARRECQRRASTTGVDVGSPTSTVRPDAALPKDARLGQDAAIDRVDALRSLAERHSSLEPGPSGLGQIEGLAHLDPASPELSTEVVFRGCNDPDPSVRALAVSLLARNPAAAASGQGASRHPVPTRLLRQALNDADARVQANAIEALDALDQPDRGRWVAEKMASPDGRVRANAIRSCLRAEMYQAAEALLDMLDAESAAHRISALWVVEMLKLRTLRTRVRELMEHDSDQGVRARARRVLPRLGEGGPNFVENGEAVASHAAECE